MNDANNRLLSYYTRIMDSFGKQYSKEKMEIILRRVPIADAEMILNEGDDAQQRQTGRIISYVEKLSSVQKKHSDDMEKLLKTVGDYDYSNEKSITVNGNTFVYKEGFPIEQYMDELKGICTEEAGEEYMVQLLDGKLVIY